MPRPKVSAEHKKEIIKAKNTRYYEKHKAELKERRLDKLCRPKCCIYVCNLPNEKVYVDMTYTERQPLNSVSMFNVQVIPVLEFTKELDEKTLRSFLYLVMKYYGKEIVMNYSDFIIDDMEFMSEVSHLKEDQVAFFNRCVAAAISPVI